MAPKNFYAVRRGRSVGMFYSWSECQDSVYGFPGALYRGFVRRDDAEAYLDDHSGGGAGAYDSPDRCSSPQYDQPYDHYDQPLNQPHYDLPSDQPYHQSDYDRPEYDQHDYDQPQYDEPLSYAPSAAAANSSCGAAGAHPYRAQSSRSSRRRRQRQSRSFRPASPSPPRPLDDPSAAAASSSPPAVDSNNVAAVAASASVSAGADGLGGAAESSTVVDVAGAGIVQQQRTTPPSETSNAAPSPPAPLPSDLSAYAAVVAAAVSASSFPLPDVPTFAAAVVAALAQLSSNPVAPTAESDLSKWPPAAPPSHSAAAAVAAASSPPARHAVLFADGAAKANPRGPCGAGGVLYSASPSTAAIGAAITSYKSYLGVRSNNEAEYHALIEGMRAALAHGVTHLTAKMDSQLVVRQMTGEYKVKAGNLQPLHQQALQLASDFESFQVQHIYRDQNAEADQLANEAIQDALPGYRRQS